MRRWIIAWGVVASTLAACGCATPQNARYIYQDGDFGVVGIPQNSPYGTKDYRKQAEELMARHFPQGYEIVRAEEVVEGQRVLDKSHKSEFETDPSFVSLSQKINVAKLAQSSSTQQKDSLPILESRIIYRRRTPEGPRGVNGYAASAKVIPEFYLDPNEMARCREKIELAELKKPKPVAVAEKATDTAAQKASHEAVK
jgi:hypothetical protein